jgi:hypothetical protein
MIDMGIMKITIAVLAALMALATVAATTAAAAQTKVFCAGDFPHTDRDVTRVRPKHCILQKRGAPDAEAFYVRTKRMHWKRWSSGQAKGKGSSVASMIGRVPVRVKLSDPVTSCGERVFSRARVRFPGLGHSKLRLNTCA